MTQALDHSAGCSCLRCRGFEAGNTVATKHGAYARLQLSDAAAETADVLRDLVPLSDMADEPLIQAAGLIVEQSKKAAKALNDAGSRMDRLRLSQDLKGWLRLFKEYCEALGLSPPSRAKLGLDVVRAQAAAGLVKDDTLDLSRLTIAQRAAISRIVVDGEGTA